MAGPATPHFKNDSGVHEIRIGVKEFKCCGASAPYDHPHVYLDMGAEAEIICPYCSTLFRFDPAIDAHDSDPKDCMYKEDAA